MSEKRPNRTHRFARGTLGTRSSPYRGADEALSLESEVLGMAERGELAIAGHEAVQRQISHGLAVTFKRGSRIISAIRMAERKSLVRSLVPNIACRLTSESIDE